MFKTISVLLLSSLFLFGCAGETQYTNRDVLNHPQWPTPITERKFDVKVLVVKDELIVGMNYEDNIEFQIYQEDILRYAKDLKAMVCFYRASLKDPNCAGQEGAN